MPCSNGRVTRHISYTAAEDQCVRNLAEAAGMGVSPFIRFISQNGSITVYPLQALTDYVMAVDSLIAAVRSMSSSPHKDRLLYQSDIEYLEDRLDELIQMTSQIMDEIRGLSSCQEG